MNLPPLTLITIMLGVPVNERLSALKVESEFRVRLPNSIVHFKASPKSSIDSLTRQTRLSDH